MQHNALQGLPISMCWHVRLNYIHEARCQAENLVGTEASPPIKNWYAVLSSWLHVILTFLFIEFTLFFRSCILILLIFTDEVVHVALCLRELHFIHALPSVPMKESLTPEHGGEVLSDALEHLLNRRRVSCKGNSHLQALWRNVADTRLDIVRDPLDKV